jgi:hypothetical protein
LFQPQKAFRFPEVIRKPAQEPRMPRQTFIAGPVGEAEPVPAFGVEPVPG